MNTVNASPSPTWYSRNICTGSVSRGSTAKTPSALVAIPPAAGRGTPPFNGALTIHKPCRIFAVNGVMVKTWGMAGLLVCAGLVACSKPEVSTTRVLHGSVFTTTPAGAVKIPLAEVYLLQETDLSAMTEAVHRTRETHAPAIARARAALDKRAQTAAESELEPEKTLNRKKAQLDEVKASGARWTLVESFQHDVDLLNKRYLELKLANLEKLHPLLVDVNRLEEAARAAVFDAMVTPPRPLAVAARTDADGAFSVTVPVGAAAVLVIAPSSPDRLAWKVRLDEVNLSQTVLFSDHNRVK